MSDLNNQFFIIATEVHNILNKYITVHDDVFRVSLRNVIPLPLIFKAIDFKQLHSKSSELLMELEERNNQLNELIPKSTPSEFANILNEFCVVLIETISLLKEITYQLHLKSEKAGDYNLNQHKQLISSYNESVKRYRSIGVKLNEYF